MSEEGQPWERRAGEPAKAHEAFRALRDLPATARRIDTVAERTGVSGRQLRTWAKRWDWWERAEAWDDELHRIEDSHRLDDLRAMHVTHREAGKVALAKAVEALGALKPDEIPASAAARLLELGIRLERGTVAELRGLDDDQQTEDPWERIAHELDASGS